MFVLYHLWNPFGGFNRWASNAYSNYSNSGGHMDPVNSAVQASFGFFDQDGYGRRSQRKYRDTRDSVDWMRWSPV